MIAGRVGTPMFVRAVESFAAQTYPHKELVFVAPYHAFNPYTTAGAEILNHPGRRYTHCNLDTDGASLGELRNVAIRASSGSIIVTMDDDDVSHPRRLERIVGAFRSAPQLMWGGSSLVTLVEQEAEKAWLYDGQNMRNELAQIYGATLAFKRPLWERCWFSPWVTNGEDVEWMRRVRECGYEPLDFRDPTMTTHYLHGSNTGTHKPEPICWREIPWPRQS